MDTGNFKSLLNARSLKATTTRLNLLGHLDQYGSAMPYSAIQKAMNPVDRVTLYRTLETLKEQGIIHKAYQEGSETYYAICGKQCKEHQHEHDHIHFKCEICKVVSCEDLEQEIFISIPKFTINKLSINLEGVCKNCNAK